MRKVELLAPAGNYESFLAAINAGADAVYLGGNRFGARAYADNLDEEHIVRALRYAHLHGKKLYLTVNTLVKERETEAVVPFLKPFADEGLDGVIVQDIGVMRIIRETFPAVELHASTQMAVTGVYGAMLLKKMNVKRVVPARELSLYEIRNIREKADIEVETFIHGAMCYCYSGMCLMSSLAGGRSGNRGRCAQPCRLPYFTEAAMDRMNENGKFYLSLKDMCTIDIIPELITAGIDSFKIEGRMKKTEYTAGVTGIYRKYIDLFLENPDKPYSVSSQDRQILDSLYIRTGTGSGYYHCHNSADMVTTLSPGYNSGSDDMKDNILAKYPAEERKLPVEMIFTSYIGKPAELKIVYGSFAAISYGTPVQEAQKCPTTAADIEKQLAKLGNSFFTCKAIKIHSDDNEKKFISVKELNELRRKTCLELERLINTGKAEK